MYGMGGWVGATVTCVDAGAGDAAGGGGPCSRHPAIATKRRTMTTATPCKQVTRLIRMIISIAIFNNNYLKTFGSGSDERV
jgi:hypothetical protein